MPQTEPHSSKKADKSHARRKLLRRYVDLAFAKEDQIMCSTKTGTSVGFAVADYFTFGLTTVIGKSIETPVISTVRGVRRAQSSHMFAQIKTLQHPRLQLLTTAARQQGEPSFDWLRNQLEPDNAIGAIASASIGAARTAGKQAAAAATEGVRSAGAAMIASATEGLRSTGAEVVSSAAAAVGTSVVSATATSAADIVQDIFVDYIADAVLDQVASYLPFGIGAVKSGYQVAQVTQRIAALRGEIQTLQIQME